MQSVNTYPSHSPKMLIQIRTQIRSTYTLPQLEKLRGYYQQKNVLPVVEIIDQEIQRRKN